MHAGGARGESRRMSDLPDGAGADRASCRGAVKPYLEAAGTRRPARDRQRQEAQHRRLRPQARAAARAARAARAGLGRARRRRSPRSSTTIRSRRWRPTSRRPSAPGDGAARAFAARRTADAPVAWDRSTSRIRFRAATARPRRRRGRTSDGWRSRRGRARCWPSPPPRCSSRPRALRARLVRARLHLREAPDRDRRDVPQAGLRGGAVGPAAERPRDRAGHVLRRRGSPARAPTPARSRWAAP